MEIYPGKMVYHLFNGCALSLSLSKCTLESFTLLYQFVFNFKFTDRIRLVLQFVVRVLHAKIVVSSTSLTSASLFSFLVDACTCLLGHLETEGLFRKSGSVVRVKALRVSDLSWLLWLSAKRSWLGICVKQWLHCSGSVGEVGSGRRVPVHSAALRCSWTPQAVLQGDAWASFGHRPTEQLSESPGATHLGGEDISNPPAVLCVASWEFKHPALLLQLLKKGFSEVSWMSIWLH